MPCRIYAFIPEENAVHGPTQVYRGTDKNRVSKAENVCMGKVSGEVEQQYDAEVRKAHTRQGINGRQQAAVRSKDRMLETSRWKANGVRRA